MLLADISIAEGILIAFGFIAFWVFQKARKALNELPTPQGDDAKATMMRLVRAILK